MQATAQATYPTGAVGATFAASDIHRRMTWSRVIGALFIAGFLSYGIGAALVTSIVGESGFVGTIPTQETLLIAGVFLMLINTGVDIGKGVLFSPAWKATASARLSSTSPRSPRRWCSWPLVRSSF